MSLRIERVSEAQPAETQAVSFVWQDEPPNSFAAEQHAGREAERVVKPEPRAVVLAAA